MLRERGWLFGCALLVGCGGAEPSDEGAPGTWFGIYMGASKVGYEHRTVRDLPAGEQLWRRHRKYLFRVDGSRAEAEGESTTRLNGEGRMVEYTHQAGGQQRRAWMESGQLVTEVRESDGSSRREVYPTAAPVGIELVVEPRAFAGQRVPILDGLSMQPVWIEVESDGDQLSWWHRDTRAVLSPTGGSFGVISWREQSQAEASQLSCCVELLSLYRMASPVLPLARSSRVAEYVLSPAEGTTRALRVERPLWAEIPPGGPLLLGPAPDVSVEILRTRLAPLLVGVHEQRAAVTRLVRWVQEELEVKVTPGSLGHLQALQRGSGDCSEHAALFVAAAQAIGIQASARWGWVYWEGAYGPGFYPHAWAQVTLDGYGDVPVDPILGQFPADATHIEPEGGSVGSSGAWLLPGGAIQVVSIAK
jgi:hypothetical protein